MKRKIYRASTVFIAGIIVGLLSCKPGGVGQPLGSSSFLSQFSASQTIQAGVPGIEVGLPTGGGISGGASGNIFGKAAGSWDRSYCASLRFKSKSKSPRPQLPETIGQDPTHVKVPSRSVVVVKHLITRQWPADTLPSLKRAVEDQIVKAGGKVDGQGASSGPDYERIRISYSLDRYRGFVSVTLAPASRRGYDGIVFLDVFEVLTQ